MIKHKGLGRGLDALLGGGSKSRSDGELFQLAVRSLRPGKYQPRTRMDQTSLEELAESIRVRGILQPVVVRPVDDGDYEILAGERRWRAAKLAGLERIPALVREVSDDAALGIGLIENIQREDLNPIEESAGLKRLIDEFRLTHEEVAKAVGRSRSAVTNLLRLLELAKAVQEMLLDGRLDMGHARALLGVSKARQVELAEQVAAKGLSVRETERLVQHSADAPKAGAKAAKPRLDADTRRLQDELSEALGASVTVHPRKAGRGSLVIDYASLEQLDGIVSRLKRP
ncbi:MAG TPA: ParB/RepB/Spo0J family partition protein [Usitatibacteraceae bacterium]|nr:ParB/RepB/Spo0J family partition protein [Usitatibacteraceae bacterium]